MHNAINSSIWVFPSIYQSTCIHATNCLLDSRLKMIMRLRRTCSSNFLNVGKSAMTNRDWSPNRKNPLLIFLSLFVSITKETPRPYSCFHWKIAYPTKNRKPATSVVLFGLYAPLESPHTIYATVVFSLSTPPRPPLSTATGVSYLLRAPRRPPAPTPSLFWIYCVLPRPPEPTTTAVLDFLRSPSSPPDPTPPPPLSWICCVRPDLERIAIGRHSYGSAMAVSLLAHAPNLFCCGIPRSGAYNRTLTPFGFQSESQTLWESPEVFKNVRT